MNINTPQNYFWNKYDKEWAQLLNKKLVLEKDTTNLLFLFSIYFDEFKIKVNTREERNSIEVREQFLHEYLLPLLKENKLRVIIMKERWATDKEVQIFSKLQGRLVKKEFASYPDRDLEQKTAEEIIQAIREKWNNVSTEDLPSFEEFGVLFALPDSDIW